MQWPVDQRAIRLTYMLHIRQLLGIPAPLSEVRSSILRDFIFRASEAFLRNAS